MPLTNSAPTPHTNRAFPCRFPPKSLSGPTLTPAPAQAKEHPPAFLMLAQTSLTESLPQLHTNQGGDGQRGRGTEGQTAHLEPPRWLGGAGLLRQRAAPGAGPSWAQSLLTRGHRGVGTLADIWAKWKHFEKAQVRGTCLSNVSSAELGDHIQKGFLCQDKVLGFTRAEVN